MLDLGERHEERAQQRRRQHQRIAAGQDDIGHLRMPGDVLHGRLEILQDVVGLAADDATPETMAAKHRARLGRHDQD